MYPSTTDDTFVTSTLTILFHYKGNVTAKLRIACDMKNEIEECRPINTPDYIDIKNSSNIEYISEKRNVNSITPIQIYCGNDRSLSPILLLEETEYDIELEEIGHDVTDKLQSIRGYEESILLKTNHFGNNGNKQIFTLYSKSYVGKGFFDVTIGADIIKIPFEIRSKKIEYIDEYPQMLSDIAEFSVPLLLDSRSPLFRNYSAIDKKRNTAYEEYIVLDYIFNKLKIESSYDTVKNNPYVELYEACEERFDGNVSYVNQSEICNIISGNNLYEFENGPILKRYSVNNVNETYYVDSVDNPENRLVKDLMLTLQSMIYSLLSKEFVKNSDFIFHSLLRMKESIDCILSDEWMIDINQLDRIPFESTVLQNRHGYSELFHIYQILGVSIAFNQNDLPGLFEGHNKKVYEVYEYWCYTRLYRCLYDMSENKPSIDHWMDNGSLSIRGKKPVTFDIIKNDSHFTIRLYYNKDFSQKDKIFRSYSINLRPDFSVIIEKDGFSNIINFDAKYKVKMKNPNKAETNDSKINCSCWEYDIYKMHTYRDALIKSLGSYVLYPGKNPDKQEWINYVKPKHNEDWGDRLENLIPSVGAIALTPGSKKDKQLIHAFNQLLEKISGLLCNGEIMIS